MAFKAKCINENGWQYWKKSFLGLVKKLIDGGESPTYGEIVTVVESESYGDWYYIDEYGDTFQKDQFIKIDGSEAIEIRFEKIKEEINIPQSVN